MTAQLPTRITIELHPGDGAGGWTARTAVVDGHDRPRTATTTTGSGTSPHMATHAAEPREELPVPAAYAPAPCTCLDGVGCDADHAND